MITGSGADRHLNLHGAAWRNWIGTCCRLDSSLNRPTGGVKAGGFSPTLAVGLPDPSCPRPRFSGRFLGPGLAARAAPGRDQIPVLAEPIVVTPAVIPESFTTRFFPVMLAELRGRLSGIGGGSSSSGIKAHPVLGRSSTWSKNHVRRPMTRFLHSSSLPAREAHQAVVRARPPPRRRKAHPHLGSLPTGAR